MPKVATATPVAAPVAVEALSPVTMHEDPDGTVTLTFRTDGTYPVNASGRSRSVAKAGYEKRMVTSTDVVIQMIAYRSIPKAQR